MLYRYDRDIAVVWFFCKTRESLNSLLPKLHVYIHVYKKIVFEQFLHFGEFQRNKIIITLRLIHFRLIINDGEEQIYLIRGNHFERTS